MSFARLTIILCLLLLISGCATVQPDESGPTLSKASRSDAEIGYTGACETAVDVAELPAGNWCEVPASKLIYVQPTPLPPGNGFEMVMKAWNGGAMDNNSDQFIVTGGGHGDYAGNEILMAPILQAFLFTSATVMLMVFSLSRLQNKNQGLIAGMVLLGTPFFIYSGSSLVADVPVGFYILATLVLYCFIDEGTKKKPGLIFICGAMAGCAAYYPQIPWRLQLRWTQPHGKRICWPCNFS